MDNQCQKHTLRYKEYYRIGKRYANELPKKLELHRIGKMLDISDEAVRKISLVALGKIIVGLKARLTAHDTI